MPLLNLKKNPIAHQKLVDRWPHLADVPLSCVGVGEVKLLIGGDNVDALDVLEYRKDPLRSNSPRAILTVFGWTIQGNVEPVEHEHGRKGGLCNAVTLTPPDNLESLVRRFFLQDECGARPGATQPVGKEVARSRKILGDTTRYVKELSRYEAGVSLVARRRDAPE